MRIMSLGIALSLVACTSMVNLNGKPLGGGGGGGGGGGSSTSSNSSDSGSGSGSGSSGSLRKSLEEEQLDEDRATFQTSPCKPEQDHCLEKDTWFAVEKYDGWPVDAFPGLWQEAHLRWIWGYRCDCQVGMRGVRTVIATPETLVAEKMAVIYWDDQRPRMPRDLHAARKGDWLMGKVTEVDAKARTFRMEGVKHVLPFALARVVVEERTDVK